MHQHRMPSAAILVAVFALVAALTGTAVAGEEARTSAITKKKVKKITTKQINKLAPGLSVASADTANNADTATNAQNAAAVGGVGAAGIDYSVLPPSGAQTIYERAGLRLRATCGGNTVSITPPPARQDSSIFTSVVDTDSNNNNNNTDAEDGLFDPGVNFDLLSGNSGNAALITFEYDAANGQSVTGTLSTDVTVPQARCEVHGNV